MKNLLKEKHLTNYNIFNILIKIGLFIKITKFDNYKKVNLRIY